MTKVHRRRAAGQKYKVEWNFKAKYIKKSGGNIISEAPNLIRPLVSQEQWDEFVAQSLEGQFQELSHKKKELHEKDLSPYKKGRIGYARIEQQMIEREGSGASSVSRHRLFIEG
ncbi:uncharacterized protein LOC129305433 [Prosopis cineraria]|uniref:uncharacterized protein LOC129305433 n=1 Tax=Prosopis cineraria TaxID=364024 RepID=UPI0024101873|nr:uncharacterized protein LOC129305433 [Prosopis cineraria]